MPTFPLHFRPDQSYHVSPRSFGALRDDGKRKHAGCDLYAPPGTPVLACLDGVVVRGPYLFYDGVYALEVRRADGSMIRYGEIGRRASVSAGALVMEGQQIAVVGKIEHLSVSMLHFEMYSGAVPKSGQGVPVPRTGPLTDVSRLPFKRRADLIDPTQFLDSCALAVSPEAM